MLALVFAVSSFRSSHAILISLATLPNRAESGIASSLLMAEHFDIRIP